MDAKGRGPRRTIGFALNGLIGLVVVVGVAQGQGPVYGRFEVGSPVEGIWPSSMRALPRTIPFTVSSVAGLSLRSAPS